MRGIKNFLLYSGRKLTKIMFWSYVQSKTYKLVIYLWRLPRKVLRVLPDFFLLLIIKFEKRERISLFLNLKKRFVLEKKPRPHNFEISQPL